MTHLSASNPFVWSCVPLNNMSYLGDICYAEGQFIATDGLYEMYGLVRGMLLTSSNSYS